jgi:hypothetical protein
MAFRDGVEREPQGLIRAIFVISVTIAQWGTPHQFWILEQASRAWTNHSPFKLRQISEEICLGK